MNLLKCSNGHYYDGDKFDTCPHCAGMTEDTVNENPTVAIDMPIEATEPVSRTIPEDNMNTQPLPMDDEMTVRWNMTNNGTDPVVGWLVCIEGQSMGRSYNLKAGKNFVGRNNGVNDIVLYDDTSVSREKHAIVIYDPKSRNFLVQPGMSSQLFYVNDEVVLQAMPIKARDIILVGNTKLMFIPFCGPEFTWDDDRNDMLTARQPIIR